MPPGDPLALRAPVLPLRFAPEVEDALHSGRPVVALESNVISHGLPRPLNLESAREVEQAVRAGTAVPATTAVIDGEIVVGLSSAELELIGTTEGVRKASSRGLAACLASGGLGATTIAATMVIAEAAGIPTVASAGMGGVHRDVAESMDISSDLVQLTRSKVMLVCAGAKSILDLPKTLEYLETECVPVIGYGSDDFPAFYLTSSGLKCPSRIDDPHELARAARFHWAIPGAGSLVVTHPIEPDRALDTATVENAIDQALAQAHEQAVSGAAVTKFLMRSVDRATAGEASAANAAVLASTASVATEIAGAWSQMSVEIAS